MTDDEYDLTLCEECAEPLRADGAECGLCKADGLCPECLIEHECRPEQ